MEPLPITKTINEFVCLPFLLGENAPAYAKIFVYSIIVFNLDFFT